LKVCFIVDARSPIARNWIAYFIGRGYEVHVLSTYPCPPDALPGASLYEVPVAFSKLSRVSHAGGATATKSRPLLSPLLASVRSGALSNISLAAHLWLTPLELRRHIQPTGDLIAKISPDLVHAMRIPFEGVLAAKAVPAGMRLLTSVWGNDFTLCAANNPLVARQTRLALRRADALHCDCRRDLNLAVRDWGFDPQKPSVTLPGAGGVQPSLFYAGEPEAALLRQLDIPDRAPVVINPRGFRGYVRNDVFFRAIPQVLLDHPDAIFVCTGMQSNPVAEGWARKLAIEDSVRLLPLVSRERMADLFRAARVAVSPSLHDGTPNSLLEALACGCFPVAGDIESVREWIEDGYNGLLCDPDDSRSVARAIARALADERLRDRARDHNLRLVAERAEYGEVMRQAEEFYARIARRRPQPIEV
jgi:glycosyltransferase involved in cell wall biosynthesis